MRKTRFCGYALVAGLTTAAGPFAAGQDSDDEEVFTLSPFTVDGSENEGYRATNTLAGTRIRTELKDIGTSIQVVTKEFLEDLASDDASSLLNYTTSTEVGGIQGNFSGNSSANDQFTSQESRGNPQSTTRVRGLFRADLTRDYFRTIIPFNSYNTGSVDINRGSNATLFGLGSPAGIINNSLDAAHYKNSGEISLRLDAEGSIRSSVNVNKVLIDDKLAIRLALLKDDREYHQEPTFQDTERVFGAVNWKILENTTFKGNFEIGEIDASRPDSTSPMEAITPWLLMGKRIIDSSLGTGIGRDLDAPTGIKVDKDGDGILDDVFPRDINAARFHDYSQFADGSFVNEGNWTWNGSQLRAPTPISFPGAERSTTGGIGQPQIWTQGVVVFGDGSQADPTIPGFKAQHAGNENFPGDALSLLGDGQDPWAQFKGNNNISGFFNNFKRQGFTNLNGYDWGRNLLAGNTAAQFSEFDAVNLKLEQTFWDNKAGFEIAYDKQTYDNEIFTPLQLNRTAQIRVDMNVRLPDGRLNPNVGRPYSLARNGRSFRNTEMETKRATAFLTHDFADGSDGWTKWLGRHTVTGLVDQNTEEVRNYGTTQVFSDPDIRRVMRTPQDEFGSFHGRLFPLVYLGPSLLGPEVQTLDDVTLVPPTELDLWRVGQTVPFTYWDPGTRADGTAARDATSVVANGRFVTRDVTVAESINGNTRFNSTTTDSEAGVWQGYFLGDSIVGTVGYRRDSVEDSLFNGVPQDSNGSDRLDAPLDEWNRLDSAVSEDRWSYGVVAHVPRGWTENLGFLLSGHYAESSNFSLLPGRVNWNDEPIANPAGETKEIGFSLSTLENKLNIRVNWFETSILNLDSGPVNFVWNNVLQRADGYYGAADTTEDPVFADFNRAVGDLLLSNLTEGERRTHNIVVENNDPNGLRTGVFYESVKSVRETEDVDAEGVEIEVTYNPTKNWRMHFNIAKQETVKSNIHPFSQALADRRVAHLNEPIPGYEWITLGELTNNAQSNPETWIIDPVNQVYGGINDPADRGYWSIANALEGRLTSLRTKQAAEGSIAAEQRKWRFNFVSNYNFSEGRLKGLSVGGAYRWQDRVSIGFPFITNADGQTVGDVANPVFAPRTDNVDLFARYKMPFLEDIGRWTLQLNVRNAFASDDDIIPVQLQGDGVSFSRVRLAPQREFILTSTLRF